MRYKFLIASLLVALIGLILLVVPVAAQSGALIEEPEGSGTACVNKGPVRFERLAGEKQEIPRDRALAAMAKFRCDPPGSNVTGSYVYVQPYRYSDPPEKHHPKEKIEGLTWDGMMEFLLQPPDMLDSGSWWFEPGNPPSGKPVMKISQVGEPRGEGTFCRGEGPLTFNGIDSVELLRKYKCQGAGTYATSRTWRTPGGERNVFLGKTGLSFEGALALLLTPPRNDNSGSLLFFPSAQAATSTPTRAIVVPTTAPVVTQTPHIIVVTATPPVAQVAVATPTLAPVATSTRTPTDQGSKPSEGLNPWLIGGLCLVVSLLGGIALLLFRRGSSSSTTD